MSKAVSLHKHFYNLLKIKKLNHFTVTEFRDALMDEPDASFCKVEARKFVYRRLLLLVNKGLMYKTDSKFSSETRYSTSELFSHTVFKTKKAPNPQGEGIPSNVQQNSNVSFLLELKKEKIIHETDLRFVTEEMEVFESLMTRFPEQKEYLEPFFYEARNRSSKLYSHVSALSKILNNTAIGSREC